MGAFLSLRRTCGVMAAAALISYIVMRIHSVYLAGILPGAEAPASEIFFAVQTVLLVCEWIFGLLAVGSCIFCRQFLPGAVGIMLKLLLIAAVSALALFAVWLVAGFGGANAMTAAGVKIFYK
ncbi:MAG: hypothetical protein ACI4J0_03150 [Huintestinicola sp.]|uniref:hypothetical protein n=1 Tax=Huintestinicola sp. TaxID=2981661 RepID=UPI003F0A3B87